MQVETVKHPGLYSNSKLNTNPIVIIDDDLDDLEIIKDAFLELEVANELISFDDGFKFIEYIKETQKKCFFILCDINMNRISGLDLKKIVFEDEQLRLKCIPFLFFSTSGTSSSVMKAYSFGVQGYFIKPNNLLDYKKMFHSMITYWGYSQHPNS